MGYRGHNLGKKVMVPHFRNSSYRMMSFNEIILHFPQNYTAVAPRVLTLPDYIQNCKGEMWKSTSFSEILFFQCAWEKKYFIWLSPYMEQILIFLAYNLFQYAYTRSVIDDENWDIHPLIATTYSWSRNKFLSQANAVRNAYKIRSKSTSNNKN